MRFEFDKHVNPNKLQNELDKLPGLEPTIRPDGLKEPKYMLSFTDDKVIIETLTDIDLEASDIQAILDVHDSTVEPEKPTVTERDKRIADAITRSKDSLKNSPIDANVKKALSDVLDNLKNAIMDEEG